MNQTGRAVTLPPTSRPGEKDRRQTLGLRPYQDWATWA
jgi:hypothetical protein